jgi:phosphoglycolate phosphatase-like HAD superfamily hydrolase
MYREDVTPFDQFEIINDRVVGQGWSAPLSQVDTLFINPRHHLFFRLEFRICGFALWTLMLTAWPAFNLSSLGVAFVISFAVGSLALAFGLSGFLLRRLGRGLITSILMVKADYKVYVIQGDSAAVLEALKEKILYERDRLRSNPKQVRRDALLKGMTPPSTGASSASVPPSPPYPRSQRGQRTVGIPGSGPGPAHSAVVAVPHRAAAPEAQMPPVAAPLPVVTPAPVVAPAPVLVSLPESVPSFVATSPVARPEVSITPAPVPETWCFSLEDAWGLIGEDDAYTFRNERHLVSVATALETVLNTRLTVERVEGPAAAFNPNRLAAWLSVRYTLARGEAFLDEYSRPGTLAHRQEQADLRQAAALAALPVTTAPTPSVPVQTAPLIHLPFKLLIFDLVWTAPLKAAREARRVPTADELAQTRVPPSLDSWLRSVFQAPDRPHLVIFSKAQRAYIGAVLGHHFPDLSFDQIIGYEDALSLGRAFKPNPALGQRLMRRLGVSGTETAVIGDHRDDIELGHGLGATTVLTRFHPQSPRDYTFLNALETQPHVVVNRPDDLTAVLRNHPAHDLPLDALYRGRTSVDLKRSLDHCRIVPYDRVHKASSHLSITVLGRYYTSAHGDHYHLPARDGHRLSAHVLDKEDGIAACPPDWALAVSWAVSALTATAKQPCVVSIIPSKAGRPSRLEQLLATVAGQMAGQPHLHFEPRLFAFNAQAQSNKSLGADARVQNLNAGLEAHPDLVPLQGARYLIIDDVLTTGATFIRARDILVAAGVSGHQVQGLAVTKSLSVSSGWHTVEA